MNINIEKAVELYINSQKTPFNTGDILGFLKQLAPHIDFSSYIPQIDEIVSMNPDILETENEYYISRQALFLGKYFSIVPDRFELQNSVLIPGCRCIPFANPDFFPSDYVFTYNGKTLPKKVITLQTNDLLTYYKFFGEEFIPHYLSYDKANSNYDFVNNNYELPGRLNVTAVDMSSVYAETGFESGCRLLLKMTGWGPPVFAVEPLIEKKANPFVCSPEDEKRKEWQKKFEESLLKVFNSIGPASSIEEQVAYAFLYAGESLFNRNCSSFWEYFSASQKVELCEYGVETRLWRKNEEISLYDKWMPQEVKEAVPDVELPMLSAFMNFSQNFIDVFIFDSLYKKETNCASVIKKLFPPETKLSTKDRLFCLLHLERRRAIISRNYNWFADFETGKLRAELLDLYMALFAYIDELDSLGFQGQLPQQPLLILSQLFGHVARMLESLVFPISLNDKDLSGMKLSLEGMQFTFEELQDELSAPIQKLRKDKFTVISKRSECDGRNKEQ